jgi:hypothetical protein
MLAIVETDQALETNKVQWCINTTEFTNDWGKGLSIPMIVLDAYQLYEQTVYKIYDQNLPDSPVQFPKQRTSYDSLWLYPIDQIYLPEGYRWAVIHCGSRRYMLDYHIDLWDCSLDVCIYYYKKQKLNIVNNCWD